jgi:hypothetical protein
LLVDRPGEHHLDDLHGFAVGDPQTVDKAAFDSQPPQHLADLGAAAMHDDRIDPNLSQQHDIACERGLAGVAAHRVSAVFYEDRLPGVATQIWQRFRDDHRFQRWGGVQCSILRGLVGACSGNGRRIRRPAGNVKPVRLRPVDSLRHGRLSRFV